MKCKPITLKLLFISLLVLLLTACHTASGTQLATATPDAPEVIATPGLATPAPIANAVVKLVPQEAEIHPNQTIHLDVTIENVQNLYGIELHVVYDPAMLTIVDCDTAKDGIQIVPGNFLKPDFVVRNQVDAASGTIDYVITQVSPTKPASGKGVLATIEFRTVKAGATELTPTILLAAPDGQAIIATPKKTQLNILQ